MAIRCESQETITHYLKSCLTLDLGVDRASHARIIREAARAAMSTIQLSLQLSCLNGACVQLSSQFAENASIVDQEESGQVRCCDESQLADEVDNTKRT
uniref:Uncharacterized protein n=1 Tax=Ditylenchus dipsaci TaxID=166011 RepID=A0A915E5J5_9BILA